MEGYSVNRRGKEPITIKRSTEYRKDGNGLNSMEPARHGSMELAIGTLYAEMRRGVRALG